MKSLKELRENIKSTKELLFNSDTECLVQHVNHTKIIYKEDDNFWILTIIVNNTIIIHITSGGRVVISYSCISSTSIEDSTKLYDFVEGLRKEIKDIFFSDTQNRETLLINDLLDLTGYEFIIYSYFKNDLIKVSDNYFDFVYRADDDLFTMNAKGDTFIVFNNNNADDSYNLFKRLDTYKETHKYIKELLESYIKEL